MKFNLKVAHRDEPTSEPWVEDYNRTEIRTQDEAREWAQRTITNFNNILRPGERARKLIEVTFENNNAVAQHDWQKTNLVTVSDPRLGLYDTLQCVVCGITAKRYGLTDVVVDRKFGAKKYRNCNPEVTR